MTFLREALLVAGKDLRIERRSRVALQQILPFGGDRRGDVRVRARRRPHARCRDAAPGLFWAAVLLAALLAIGRSFAIEEANGARDGLRLSGLDGGAIFVGKAAAIAVELFLLEVVLGAAVVVLYDVTVQRRVRAAVRGRGRDHRTGGDRYGLRRARDRTARAATRSCPCSSCRPSRR